MIKTSKTKHEVWAEYEKLSCPKKLEVLWAALDYMSQYNGRTQFDCIALALGYHADESEDNVVYVK